jgi:Lrp/AsnC family leucine-responsive transcriptional regulator
MLILDDLDHRILRELQRDGQMTFQQLGSKVHASAPTCQRRVKRLRQGGVIEKVIAVVSTNAVGNPLTAILEITLTKQDSETLQVFESVMANLDQVQQCYRVSTGPDFIVIIVVPDMSSYHIFANEQLMAANAVRNVRTFFSIHRAKFDTRIPTHRSAS